MAELHVIAPTTIPDTQKLRVGAYVRVSTDSEDQENSFLTQYDFYSQFIQSKSEWEFVDMYADEGITGTEMKKEMTLTEWSKIVRKADWTLYLQSRYRDSQETHTIA